MKCKEKSLIGIPSISLGEINTFVKDQTLLHNSQMIVQRPIDLLPTTKSSRPTIKTRIKITYMQMEDLNLLPIYRDEL